MTRLQEMELKARLNIIGKYYDLDALLEDKTDNQAIAKYYRKSDFFYKLVLCKGGRSIHMGISDDDFFHKEDFMRQAQFVGENITDDSMTILEVGAGKLANIKYLAKKFPNNQFTALDIPNRKFLKNRVPKNVKLVEGDYKDLSNFPENSFDIIFGVETLSYSGDKRQVLQQFHKVLKPGGKVIIFDGYENKPQSEMTDFEKRVIAILDAGMRVTPKDHYIGDMIRYLEEENYTNIESTDITENIRPTLRKLENLAGFYFRHPRFLKIMRKLISDDATINGITGWLMLFTTDGELHLYNRLVATKK